MIEREIPAATAGDFLEDLEKLYRDYASDRPGGWGKAVIRLAAHYKREAERLNAAIDSSGPYARAEVRSRIEGDAR